MGGGSQVSDFTLPTPTLRTAHHTQVCQFSSSRLDILPHLWIEKFATLQDDVPPKPAPEIIRIVEKSYGKPIGQLVRACVRGRAPFGWLVCLNEP